MMEAAMTETTEIVRTSRKIHTTMMTPTPLLLLEVIVIPKIRQW
jgi:hypothetical protein